VGKGAFLPFIDLDLSTLCHTSPQHHLFVFDVHVFSFDLHVFSFDVLSWPRLLLLRVGDNVTVAQRSQLPPSKSTLQS
jgi:hypothetical protein